MHETRINDPEVFKTFNFAILMQGPIINGNSIDKNVIRNIKTVRKFFPSLNIVVSCWQTNSINKAALKKISRYINFDIIYNDDPGELFTFVCGAKIVCNLNRMIVSTINALKVIDEEYVIKLRTDSFFSSDKFNDVIHDFYTHKAGSLHRDKSFTVFEERIINGNLFARDAKGYLPYLFHPGDIILAGLKRDLIKLFDIDLANKEIFCVSRRRYFYAMMRYVPEQYIWVKCIQKVTGNTPFHGNSYFSNELIELSEKYYINNFFLIESDDVDFHWPKHKNKYNNKGRYSLYNKEDWHHMYYKYILKLPYDYYLNGNHKKKLITRIMIVYFMIRTTILRFPFVRMIAIKIFSKRG